jgi:nucleoside-diphosphate kinase
MEQTFVMIKPDGVSRGLVGETIRRYEAKGLKLVDMRLASLTGDIAKIHYGEHVDKPFFPDLVKHVTSGPVVLMVLSGESAVAAVRGINGATNPVDATPGSLRGDFALEITANIVHGSDSPESAAREIGIFFPDLGR